ncbi:MAG: superoxide dismutase family protein [Acidobacteria bacterium]|nr:superoxide dismutase family protein [Acidobacteriota bacterium]MBV9476385.1 superoxide dismutase family protein [Acidobacteriota bacterium]
MKNLSLLSLGLLLLVAAACMTTSQPVGLATLAPTSGSNAHGTVKLTQLAGGGVQMKIDLMGVPPGTHGFHIHEKGDCGDNGNAAGGHFNPTAMQHGAPDMMPHHAGDFGNVTAEANGEVHTTVTTQSITLSAGEASAIGHAFILHGGTDDLKSQPSGNAGPRIACGVVTLQQ